MITLLGLGPADAGHLTEAARDILRAAPRLFVRTTQHPAVTDLQRASDAPSFRSFDTLYDTAADFETVYETIAETLLNAAQEADIVYAVPGHPLVAEESVRRLLERARAAALPVRIVGSASFLEPTLAALSLSLSDGLTLLDALTLDRYAAQPALGLLLYQIYDRQVASDVKLRLMRDYPDEWEVHVVHAAGVPNAERIEILPLHRLDRAAVSHLSSVYVPPLPPERRRKTFADLVEVMARLRGEGGCPWDREQTHQTLRRYMIEECYEAIEAIDADDMDALSEELGDVLLQVVFHAQLETEIGVFTIDDVIAHIVNKLIRRHPHVFGTVEVSGSEEVLKNWEQIKKAEKGAGWRESLLDGIPAGLPALMRATEVSKRVVKVGFEWETFADVMAKFAEETQELQAALQSGDKAAIFGELGDLLFTVCQIARWQKLDPEDSLRQMLVRFTARFQYIEQAAREQNRPLESLTLAEMDALWNEAKQKLQHPPRE